MTATLEQKTYKITRNGCTNGSVDINGNGAGHKKKKRPSSGDHNVRQQQRRLMSQPVGNSGSSSGEHAGKRTRTNGIVKSPTELWLV